jgi:hypothetical protein
VAVQEDAGADFAAAKAFPTCSARKWSGARGSRALHFNGSHCCNFENPANRSSSAHENQAQLSAESNAPNRRLRAGSGKTRLHRKTRGEHKSESRDQNHQQLHRFFIAARFNTGDLHFVNQVVQTTDRSSVMNKTSFYRTAVRNTLIAAGLAAGFGIGTAGAASGDDSNPQAHSDSASAAVGDTVITAKVKAKLMGEDSLKKSEISVTTTNGVVTLDGSASGSHAKSAAEAATKLVAGVRSVDNNLETPANVPSAKVLRVEF